MAETSPGRVEWLKALRSDAIEAIDHAENGLHHLGAVGDEHLRDAIEAWLEHHRALAAKLDRRIRLESGHG